MTAMEINAQLIDIGQKDGSVIPIKSAFLNEVIGCSLKFQTAVVLDLEDEAFLNQGYAIKFIPPLPGFKYLGFYRRWVPTSAKPTEDQKQCDCGCEGEGEFEE
jgi:hypothetical protein